MSFSSRVPAAGGNWRKGKSVPSSYFLWKKIFSLQQSFSQKHVDLTICSRQYFFWIANTFLLGKTRICVKWQVASVGCSAAFTAIWVSSHRVSELGCWWIFLLLLLSPSPLRLPTTWEEEEDGGKKTNCCLLRWMEEEERRKQPFSPSTVREHWQKMKKGKKELPILLFSSFGNVS